MKRWSKEDKERAIALLRSEYAYIKDEKFLNSSQKPNNKISLKKMISNFKLRLFEEEKEEEIINNNKINNYLDRFWTPQANSDKNPFK
ncbi:41476_t:CDS:1, partial [Gigaspora margarita]